MTTNDNLLFNVFEFQIVCYTRAVAVLMKTTPQILKAQKSKFHEHNFPHL